MLQLRAPDLPRVHDPGARRLPLPRVRQGAERARLAGQGRHARPDPLALELRRSRSTVRASPVTKVLVALNVIMFVIGSSPAPMSLMGGGSGRRSNIGGLYVPSCSSSTSTGACSARCSSTRASSTSASTCGPLWVVGGFMEVRSGGQVRDPVLRLGFAGSVLVLAAAPLPTSRSVRPAPSSASSAGSPCTRSSTGAATFGPPRSCVRSSSHR